VPPTTDVWAGLEQRGDSAWASLHYRPTLNVASNGTTRVAMIARGESSSTRGRAGQPVSSPDRPDNASAETATGVSPRARSSWRARRRFAVLPDAVGPNSAITRSGRVQVARRRRLLEPHAPVSPPDAASKASSRRACPPAAAYLRRLCLDEDPGERLLPAPPAVSALAIRARRGRPPRGGKLILTGAG